MMDQQQLMEFDTHNSNSTSLPSHGGLLYDQTISGRPRLLDEATQKYLPLPNIPVQDLHRYSTTGDKDVDEIVACRGGYLCYNLQRRKRFLICNPTTGSVKFIPHGDTFSNKSILSVHLTDPTDDQMPIVIVAVQGEETSTAGDNNMRFLTAYYFDIDLGDHSWVVGRHRHFARIISCNLPVSSCELEGAIYYLGYDERFASGNRLDIWKHDYDMIEDCWYAMPILNDRPLVKIEWMWLIRGNNEKYRQTSPALFAYNNKLFVMSGFVKQISEESGDETVMRSERRIALWRLDRNGDGFVVELEVEFPKALWALRMEKYYDFAQFGDCFLVFDVRHGCGRAYNYIDKTFNTIPCCELDPAFSNLKAFNYKPYPNVP